MRQRSQSLITQLSFLCTTDASHSRSQTGKFKSENLNSSMINLFNFCTNLFHIFGSKFVPRHKSSSRRHLHSHIYIQNLKIIWLLAQQITLSASLCRPPVYRRLNLGTETMRNLLFINFYPVLSFGKCLFGTLLSAWQPHNSLPYCKLSHLKDESHLHELSICLFTAWLALQYGYQSVFKKKKKKFQLMESSNQVWSNTRKTDLHARIVATDAAGCVKPSCLLQLRALM